MSAVGAAPASGTAHSTGTAHPTVHIDWTRCEARGACMELLAGVLRADDWGFPVADGAGSDVPIPAGRMPDARNAVALCPRLALSIREPGAG